VSVLRPRASTPGLFADSFCFRIEAIATHRDRVYSDPAFRSTIGVFYGQYTSPAFQRQMKENRKIEEIILTFVTSASTHLKKRAEGDEWKGQLMDQVGLFVSVVRDCMRSKDVRSVPPEILARLDNYAAKLTPSSGPTPSSSSSSPRTSLGGLSLYDMPLVLQVGKVFNVSDAQMQRDLVAIKRVCTAKVTFLFLNILSRC
jgi:hypothetical protein